MSDLNDLKKNLKPGERLVVYMDGVITNDTKADRFSVQAEPPIGSDPPPGHYRVVNFYVDADTKKLVVEYDNTPAA
jgi:hypothetical protein